MIVPTNVYFKPIENIFVLFFVLSKVKTNIESAIFNVTIGINKLTVVLNKSYVPYSVVFNIFVYNGTNKKESNFVPN